MPRILQQQDRHRTTRPGVGSQRGTVSWQARGSSGLPDCRCGQHNGPPGVTADRPGPPLACIQKSWTVGESRGRRVALPCKQARRASRSTQASLRTNGTLGRGAPLLLLARARVFRLAPWVSRRPRSDNTEADGTPTLLLPRRFSEPHEMSDRSGDQGSDEQRFAPRVGSPLRRQHGT